MNKLGSYNVLNIINIKNHAEHYLDDGIIATHFYF